MMMTSVALSKITTEDIDHRSLSTDVSLLLASHTFEGTAKLICCNWLQKNECWQDSIKWNALAKRYHLAGSRVELIAADQLEASNPEQQLLLTAISQIQEYLQGDRQAFDLPLDVSLGTPFQQKVWQALQQIPYGETISYAKLAQRVDNPKGFRAVANANGKNPLSIIIPCHRVIASDGKLGGYTGGLDKKRFLLAIEGSKYKI